MKQFFTSRILLAGAIVLVLPASMLAQNNNPDKVKSKDVEQIIITRKGDDDSKKTVIEIQGDKVLINGKNINDIKDGEINVRLRKVKDMDALVEDKVRRAEERARRAEDMEMNFNFDFDNNGAASFFSADSNRAMLGVMTDSSAKGAAVKSVTKESAAEKAGLKVGDIITAIDNKKVAKPADLTENVRKHKPGDKINISILRDGKKQNLTAELGKWQGMTITTRGFRMMQPGMPPPVPGAPDMDEMPFFYKEGHMGGNTPKLGISIQDSEDGKGVKVLDVDEESNAAKAGIKEDDIITRINDKDIKSVDEVAREVRQNRDKTSLNFQILRKGKTQNIEVKIPRKLKTADL